MKKKIVIALIFSYIASVPVKADFAYTEPSDYTGEAFFAPPAIKQEEPVVVNHEQGVENTQGTIPPLKLLRLKIKERSMQRDAINNQLAPTADDTYMGEIETSEYASKELEEKFDDGIVSPDGFESDENLAEESHKKKKSLFKRDKKENVQENSEQIILDCKNVDYDTEKYLVKATGDVSVEFVKQGITVKADIITFDRANNTIKAEGDVRILKGGQTITGDYIFVDMNEENALIENPQTLSTNVEIKAEKGYVYGDKIVQEEGSINVKDSFPINFYSAKRGPQMHTMLMPKGASVTESMENGLIKIEVKDIKIKQKGDLETISITKPRLYKGEKVYKLPSAHLYTNKNHDFVEKNGFEIGVYRGLGLYAGPGVVFELPKGSVLKAMPILNYKSGFGIGGFGRFSSGTNQTMLGYGTANSKFVGYGKQKIDDDLYLHYGVNGFMSEWFMGRRRPKYGVSLVYDKGYGSNGFLLKDRHSSFRHRVEGGYFQDLDFDGHFEHLSGNNIGTTRFRYMAEARQSFFERVNKEELKAVTFGLVSQLSASVYGTGDTQVVGRLGPTLHTQYKRWMQDLGFYFSAYDDNTPMPVFDAYRYGKQNLFIREYFRVNKYLTVSWFGSINLTNDSPNGRDFQENAFYFSIGPDDMKLNLGYDFIRENLYCSVEMMMDAKGAKIDYETLEIKQEKKASKDKKPVVNNTYTAPTKQKVLQRAVVEDVKVYEDVL